MNVAITVVLVLGIVALLMSLWASSIATRLNRLNIRTDEARLSLEAALGRRAAVVSALFPELAERTSRVEALDVMDPARPIKEHELAVLVRDKAESLTAKQAAALADAQARVEMAIRFYNHAASDTRALRLRPLVKALRLAGHAAVPEFYEAVGVETPLDS